MKALSDIERKALIDKRSWRRSPISVNNFFLKACLAKDVRRIVNGSSCPDGYFGYENQSLCDNHLMERSPMNMEATFHTKQGQCR